MLSSMTKGEIVDHWSLIVIDANNKYWKSYLLCDPCSGHDVLDGVMLVCDPCSGHISTKNDIWMMVVMVVIPMEPLMVMDDLWSPCLLSGVLIPLGESNLPESSSSRLETDEGANFQSFLLDLKNKTMI